MLVQHGFLIDTGKNINNPDQSQLLENEVNAEVPEGFAFIHVQFSGG